ncbi:hypothetical protein VTK73DRAFT_3954 [Phialemonium thermophilum]|uniref:Uncharacterized protein n=1 Tax=Phialemonium thermophilum TaxID=223376 RepID=A0ABR3XZI8_9PEZI
MESKTTQRYEDVHDLDLQYQESRHQFSMVVKDEEARKLRLRTVLVHDDNGTLKEQLAQKRQDIKKLTERCDMLRDQLEAANQRSRQLEKQMRLRERELSALREEMNSLNDAAQDSARILTEKLALSRELTLLKPEVEHLRSQLSHQKDVLAEKLALERQVNTLEVELANEKRAAQKAATARQQSRRDSDVEENLRNQVRDLEKELAKTRRAAQKVAQGHDTRDAAVQVELNELREKLVAAETKLAVVARNDSSVPGELDELRQKLAATEKALQTERDERAKIQVESERALAEAESRRLPLEEKLDNAKARLRETREQLKQCRADLQKAQGQAAAKKPAARRVMGKKRLASEMSADEVTIRTPDKDEGRPKRTLKRVFAPAGLGEKSTFSITPFLNKTINISDLSPKPHSSDMTAESPSRDPSQDGPSSIADQEVTAGEQNTASIPGNRIDPAATKVSVCDKKPRSRPAGKALVESSPSKQNMSLSKIRKAPSAESTLEKVMEETEKDAEQENKRLEETTRSGKTDDAAEKESLRIKATKITKSETTAIEAPAALLKATEQTNLKKKKRKLIGGGGGAVGAVVSAVAPSTLFDGEADADDAERPSLGVVKALGKANVVQSTDKPAGSKLGSTGVRKRTAVGLCAPGIRNAFAGATFSPLKRDRRGVNASFLA